MFFNKKNYQKSELADNIEEIDRGGDTDNEEIVFYDDEIVDKREDGEFAYYYVKRKFFDNYVYEWQPEDQLRCSKAHLKKFNEEYREIQKIKKKREKERKVKKSQKSKLKDRVFPCACAKDSPFDPNRSFRGSLCDFH